MELKVRRGSEAWLRRYKNFRALEESRDWLADRLMTANADIEQLRDQIDRDRTEVKLAEQVLSERLMKARLVLAGARAPA